MDWNTCVHRVCTVTREALLVTWTVTRINQVNFGYILQINFFNDIGRLILNRGLIKKRKYIFLVTILVDRKMDGRYPFAIAAKDPCFTMWTKDNGFRILAYGWGSGNVRGSDRRSPSSICLGAGGRDGDRAGRRSVSLAGKASKAKPPPGWAACNGIPWAGCVVLARFSPGSCTSSCCPVVLSERILVSP